MDNPAYVALSRQSGLLKAMQTVANNLANISTTGFRREGVIFAEMLQTMPDEPGMLAMTAARVRQTDTAAGGLTVTGGTYDFGIEGPGFFRVMTPGGERLTRNGAFSRSGTGELVTSQGHQVLDAGGAPLFLPPDATSISVSADGTIDADGTPVGQMGLVEVRDLARLTRETGLLFEAPDGTIPSETTRVIQGSLESSNVDPVLEMTRMIEIQRSYELGQTFMEREDDRIRATIRSFGQQG